MSAMEISGDVYAFEIDLDKLLPFVRFESAFAPWSRYPKTSRDLAFVVPEAQDVAPMADALAAVKPEIVRAVHVFDVYKGKGVADGKKIGSLCD
ncbi:MAG: hypothetical protein M5R36_20965 [Deltaproteobacteria bacterium]|nr:hypothetical protein [Deltaproteobacteria bacterium]